MKKTTIRINSLEKLEEFAKDLISKLSGQSRERLFGQGKKNANATLIALSGDLGSGKTAFVQAVARTLGIEEAVTSPTFIIEKIYILPSLPTGNPQNSHRYTHLIHIDAYRLEKASELAHLGWNEVIADPCNLIFIEWPEKVADIIPDEAIHLSFKFVDERTREISSPI